MPLSTSSSNDRLPTGPWIAIGALSVVVLLILLAGWELFWRHKGFEPSVNDDNAPWVTTLLRLKHKSTVLIGSSRIQTDIDPELWAGSPDSAKPLQLGIASSSFLPVLELLAEDDQFTGTAIVDFSSLMTFDATGVPDRPATEMVAAYRIALASPAKRIEANLRFLTGGHFAFQSPALSFTMFLHNVVHREWPQPIVGVMRRNRWVALDFQAADTSQRIRALHEYDASHGRPASDAERDAIIMKINTFAGTIRNRGGRVVFVQFPRSGVIREVEEVRYPRKRYWDVFSRAVQERTITADDAPSLVGFRCPDGSHLDFRDVPRFTAALRILVEEENR